MICEIPLVRGRVSWTLESVGQDRRLRGGHHGSRPGPGVRHRRIRVAHVLAQGGDPREGDVGGQGQPRHLRRATGCWPESAVAGILARIATTQSVEEAGTDADFVIESIAEKMDAKKALYDELDARLSRADHLHQQHLVPQHLRGHAGAAPARRPSSPTGSRRRTSSRWSRWSRVRRPARRRWTSSWSCSRRSTGCPRSWRSSSPGSASTASCASSAARSSSCSTTAT